MIVILYLRGPLVLFDNNITIIFLPPETNINTTITRLTLAIYECNKYTRHVNNNCDEAA